MINDLLLKSLTNFYNKNDNMENLYKILKNQNKASLRLVDWFTTNYSKKYNIIYLLYKDEYDRKTINETENVGIAV